MWRSIDFKLLFEGTKLESEIDIWQNTVSLWLQVVGFLECDNQYESPITNANFKANIESLIFHMRVIKPKPITPYMHVLLNHVGGMLDRYGTIKQFNTSAQELKNYTQTMQQFRGCNQHNTPSALTSHQLLSIWFIDLPSTTTPIKRQNFRKISTNSLFPSLPAETFPIPLLPDSHTPLV